MVLANWEYSYNGLTFGGNSKYGVISVDGLASSPDVREDIGTMPIKHGGWSYLDRYDARTVTIEGDLNDNATFEASLDAIKLAFYAQANPLPLAFKRPGMSGGGTRTLNCKPEKFTVKIDFDYQLGYAQWIVQLHADDPFLYDGATPYL